MMTAPSAIMYEAVLSAINLGLPPTASLGFVDYRCPKISNTTLPLSGGYSCFGSCFLSSLLPSFFRDGLRDAFDPKSNKEN